MAHLLEVRDLVTRFYTREGVIYAVNGISFTMDEGQSLAIVGESGSGKSVSVLSIIGLLESPPGKVESGKAFFNGRDLLKLSPQKLARIRGRELAMVFQDPMTALNPVLTIGRQMTEGMERHLGFGRKQANARAIELLSLVGLPDPKDRLSDYPHQLSGGQRQRVGIAMALACEPLLLIADEPTTALDVTIQAQILDLVQDLRERFGLAIIWITHDLGVVANLVERVAVMYAGFIVEMAPTLDLYENTSHPYTVGLMESLPDVAVAGQKRLQAIPGFPPAMDEKPTHCPFAPRCRWVVDKCWEENPPLIPLSPNHLSACWRADEVRMDDAESARPGENG